jgi:hypothetical protein
MPSLSDAASLQAVDVVTQAYNILKDMPVREKKRMREQQNIILACLE